LLRTRQQLPGRVDPFRGLLQRPVDLRQVVQLLCKSGDGLPWQRVVGAGGVIRLRLEMGQDQRVRLEMEGVRFRGKRIAMEDHQHVFRR
jgi:methylated-DNA-protein-cysteine methyltransferase related protein